MSEKYSSEKAFEEGSVLNTPEDSGNYGTPYSKYEKEAEEIRRARVNAEVKAKKAKKEE